MNSALRLKDVIQLHFHGGNHSIHVLFSVVDVRRESHSVALLGGDADLVILVQPVIKLLIQQWFSIFRLAFTSFSLPTT